jgi:predicted Zn-dependent protease
LQRHQQQIIEIWPVAACLATPIRATIAAMDKIAMLSQILKQNPTDAFARYGLAMALNAEGQPDRALAEFDRTIADHPDYVPAYQMAAQTLLKAGRSDDARERLTGGLAAAARTGNTHATSEMQAMLDDLN